MSMEAGLIVLFEGLDRQAVLEMLDRVIGPPPGERWALEEDTADLTAGLGIPFVDGVIFVRTTPLGFDKLSILFNQSAFLQSKEVSLWIMNKLEEVLLELLETMNPLFGYLSLYSHPFLFDDDFFMDHIYQPLRSHQYDKLPWSGPFYYLLHGAGIDAPLPEQVLTIYQSEKGILYRIDPDDLPYHPNYKTTTQTYTHSHDPNLLPR